MKWLLILFHPLTLCLVCSAQLTMFPPGIVFIDENQADILLFNGTYIWQDTNCTIQAVEGQSNIPVIDISTDYVTTVGTCTFNVTLLTPIDYEKVTTLNIFVTVRQKCYGVETQQRINKLVVVTNLLDTPPAFTKSIYSVSVPENQVVNTPVVVNIQAIDADGIDSVNYTINFVDQQKNMFRVHPQSNPEILDILLISSLDFEKNHVHHFTITATDTVGMNSTCEVVIKIINIQDTPPFFTALQYIGRISEEAKLGSSVLTVSATDGDSVFTQDQWEGTRANQIYYYILSGDAGMFGINSSTGVIITVQELDIDSNTNVTNGLVALTVMAKELNTSLEPQYGVSSATVLILVQIEDANDNRPQFSSQIFTGNIRADAAVGELITIESGGYISVFDIDQAPSNNRFCLHIEKDGQPWDVFKSNIEKQYAYASVMIQLNKNNSLKDFGDTHVKFQIVAQECGDLSQNFPATKSEMTLWIKAHTVPAAPTEPVIDLPLSASDIIVFIVGLLLLLNIGLTIFVCYALRGGRGYTMSPFKRNSKYYVSNKNNIEKENTDNLNTISLNEELGNTDAQKLRADQDFVTRSDMPTISEQFQAKTDTSTTPVSNTFTFSAKKSQSDVTLLKGKDIILSHDNSEAVIPDMEQERNSETQKYLAADVRDYQMKSQATLLTILNENNSLNHTVTPPNLSYSSTSSQQNQPANEPSNLEQGLSNFLGKVQQKFSNGSKYEMDEKDGTFDRVPLHEKSASLQSDLTETTHINSNSSSFSEKAEGDGVPLIKSPRVKYQSNVENLQNSITADSPGINEKAKDSSKQNEENKNSANLQGTNLEKAVPDSWSRETKKGNKSILSQTKDKKRTQQNSSPLNFNSSTYLTTSQITQTGVPPVALALPFSTGTLNMNKEPHLGVINPVFETSVTRDNEQKACLIEKLAESGLACTSSTFDKKNLPMSEPLLYMPAAQQNLAVQATSSGTNNPPNVEDIRDKQSESSLTFHVNSLSYTDGDPHEPSTVSPKKSMNKEKTKKFPSNPLSPAENTSSSPSILSKLNDQDYVTAAKNLLTAAKQDKRPEIKSKPKKTVTIIDVKQEKKQNMPAEIFTSF